MKTKDLMLIGSAALTTAALTVALFGGGSTIAGDDATPGHKIAQPRFNSHGVEMTLAPRDGRLFQAGDKPEFVLTAVNTTDQPAEITVDVAMTASSPRDLMSRMVRMPVEIWHQNPVITLAPKETKTLNLAAATNLAPQMIFSVWLREPAPAVTQPQPNVIQSVGSFGAPTFQTGIIALNFSTATNLPAGRLNLTAVN